MRGGGPRPSGAPRPRRPHAAQVVVDVDDELAHHGAVGERDNPVVTVAVAVDQHAGHQTLVHHVDVPQRRPHVARVGLDDDVSVDGCHEGTVPTLPASQTRRARARQADDSTPSKEHAWPPSTTSGIAIDELSDDVRPQDDLFRHVNGRWLATTEIPEDRAAHGTFHVLRDRPRSDVRAIIEEAAAGDPAPGTESQGGRPVRRFMDATTVEALARRAARRRPRAGPRRDSTALSWSPCSAGCSAGTAGPGRVVRQHRRQRRRAATSCTSSRPGWGCPTSPTTARTRTPQVRAAYVPHVEPMLGLADGPDPETPRRASWRSRPRLATGHWDHGRQPRRGEDLQQARPRRPRRAGPGSTGRASSRASGRPCGAFDEVVVRQPDHVELDRHGAGRGAGRGGRDWLAWHLVHAHAPLPVGRFVDANFDFYGAHALGRPRAARALEARRRRGRGRAGRGRRPALRREALPARRQGRAWTAGRQPRRGLPASHHRARVDERRRPRAARRSPSSTRFTPKIGYPDTWRDYSARSRSTRRPARATCAAPPPSRYDRQTRQARQARSTATSGS